LLKWARKCSNASGGEAHENPKKILLDFKNIYNENFISRTIKHWVKAKVAS